MDNKEKSNKKKKIIILVIMLVVIISLFLFYKFFLKGYIVSEKRYNEVVEFENQKLKYCDKVQSLVVDYIESNGEVPDYKDIAEDIKKIDDTISCNFTINNDGSIYGYNCYGGLDPEIYEYIYVDDVCGNEGNTSKIYFYKRTNANTNYIFADDTKPNVDDYVLLDKYLCESKDCKSYTSSTYADRFIIYDNKKYYIYKPSNKNKNVIDLGEEKYQSIDFLTYKNKDYGIVVQKENKKIALYNLELKKYVTDFFDGYSSLANGTILEQGYFQYYLSNNNELKTIIIKLDTGEKVKEIDNSSYVSAFNHGKNILYRSYMSGSQCISHQNKLYDADFKPLTGNDIVYYNRTNIDGTITLMDDNDHTSFSVYDYDKEIYTSKKYKEVVTIVEDYVFVFDDGDDKLKLIDLNENVVATFPEVEKGYKLLKKETNHVKADEGDTVYILLENKNLDYDDDKRFGKYVYNIDTNETKVTYFKGQGAAICSQ